MTIKTAVHVLALMLCALPVVAKPSVEQQKQAIAGALQQLHQAMIEGDSASLHKLTADELTYGHSTGMTEDRETFIKSVVARNPDYKVINFQEPTIVIKNDTAWARGNFQAEIQTPSGPQQIAFKMLYVFARDHGAWKLLARQAVK